MSAVVSILMPSLNQARFLPEALESVLGQDFRDLELIVADGRSTDGSHDILRRAAEMDARVRWKSAPDGGPAEALNKAALEARGEFIGWLNADDVLAPGALAAAVEMFCARPDLVLVYGHGEFTNEEGDFTDRFPTKPAETPVQEFARGCFICQPTVLMRRSAWEAVGGLDDSLGTAFDFDLWLRFWKQWPGRIGMLDRVQAKSRMHGATITSTQREKATLEALLLLRQHLGVSPPHWLLHHFEEIMAAHPDGTERSLREKLEAVLGKAAPLLTVRALAEVEGRLREDRRVELGIPGLFIGCHPDGWIERECEVRAAGACVAAGVTLVLQCHAADRSGRDLVVAVLRDGEELRPAFNTVADGRRFQLAIPLDPPGESRGTLPSRLRICLASKLGEGPRPDDDLTGWQVPLSNRLAGGESALELDCSGGFSLATGQMPPDSRWLTFRILDAAIDQHAFRLPAAGSGGDDLALFGGMLAIWHLRPFLQKRFPLHRGNARDALRFMAWCFGQGCREYAVLRELPAWESVLSRPVSLPPLDGDRWDGLFSLGMLLYAVNRYNGSLSALLRTPRARVRTARAFWRGHRHELGLGRPAAWQRFAILQRFGSVENFAGFLRLPEHDNDKTDADLAAEFRLEDLNAGTPGADEDRPAPVLVLGGHEAISPLPVPLRVARWLQPVVAWFDHLPSEPDRAAVTRRIAVDYEPPRRIHGSFGVNLFGYARGELGIGEDVRHVAIALQSQNVPVCIVNFEPGKNISQGDRTADHLISEEPRHAINLFCMTGIETTRYACEKGLGAFDGRYNVGLWPWELPDWPESCRHAYACVDEIWGISTYAAHAHRHAAPRPVMRMGLPVVLGPIGTETRVDFGLPGGSYLYAFAFDINSSAARKNPEGLIRAFQMAFPKSGSENVGLVLKISHPETGCKLWPKIRKAAAEDPRIHIIERTMRRPELLALLRCCDCFVSLHRAEGFGRGPAEALLLGKQLVVTGFSGNLDFCHEPRAALVRHRMVPLQPGDYMWGDGQRWAEPDLAHAAELMRSVRTDPRPTCREDGSSLSAEAAGRRYAVRIREIWDRYHDI